MACNFFARGQQTERMASSWYHGRGTPLLVSPLTLRSLGLGQVDVCFIDGRGSVVVVESKTAGHISPRQLRRLLKACSFLGAILKKTVRLECFTLKPRSSL